MRRSDARRAGRIGCAAALLASVALAGCEREADLVTAPSAVSFVERVAPPRRAADGQPPLLVLLHGIGADENDLVPIAAMLDPRLHVVSLRAPRPYAVGHAWFDIQFGPAGIRPDVAQARRSLADLVAWIEAAPARHGTDPARTYLLGFSQGAMMSLGVLGTVPERLAGVVVLSGRNAEGLFPATAPGDAIARVPLLVAHGTYDDLLPVENGRAIRDAFAAVSADFTYHEFPVAHGVSEEEIVFVAGWLRERLGREAP